MTAISPCPLATNITAIGFIGKDIENRNRVFYNGLVYTLGRAISYTLLAFYLFLGSQFQFAGLFQKYGEKIIGSVIDNNWSVYARYIENKIPGDEQLHNG